MDSHLQARRSSLVAAVVLAVTVCACSSGRLDSATTACTLDAFNGDLVREGDRAVLLNASWPSTTPRLELQWPAGWSLRSTAGSELEVLDANGVTQARTGTAVLIGAVAAAGVPPGTPLYHDGALVVCPPVVGASTSTSVNGGGGFVAKDDVRRALGLQSEDELQAYAKAHDLAFTARFTEVLDNMVRFADGTEMHVPHTITYTAKLRSQARVNEAGVILSGWNLLGAPWATSNVVDTGADAIPKEITKGKLAGKQVAESRIDDEAFATSTWDEYEVDGGPLPITP